MSTMERGQDASARFFHDGYVALADKSIIPMGNLTKERFEDIGWKVARQRYRSVEAREDFAAGWLTFGLPTIEVMRGEALRSRESHCNQGETMSNKIIQFRTRRVQ